MISSLGAIELPPDVNVRDEELTLSPANPGLTCWTAGGTNAWRGPVRLNVSPTIEVYRTTGRLIIDGPITGPAGFTKAGAGTLELAGMSANSYAGDTVVNEGALEL